MSRRRARIATLPKLVGGVWAIGGLPAAAVAAASGRLGGGEPLDVSLPRILIALLICATIAVLAALAIRRRGRNAELPRLFSSIGLRQREIDVVETRRLSPHADICLVRHGGHEYLLVLAAGRAHVLNERPIAPADREGRA